MEVTLVGIVILVNATQAKKARDPMAVNLETLGIVIVVNA
jgi:hypothetical protein